MKRKLVEVTWQDSAFYKGWHPKGQHVAPSSCRTTGYLVEKTGRHVVVAMNSEDDDGGYGEAMAIPRSCISAIRKL